MLRAPVCEASRGFDVANMPKQASQVKIKSSPPTPFPGLRSTFDRLPYGCLLFMYRLDR